MQLDSSKPHVKNFIEIMINDKKQEWIKVVCNRGVFPFIYNEIINANQNPGFNLEKFQKSQHVAVEFTTYAINFQTKKSLEKTYRYFFCLNSIYLVERRKQ